MRCRLKSWTKSNAMIRNHSVTAAPALIVSDVNLNLSCCCFFHNHGILFSAIIRTPCSINIWSPGHFVPEDAPEMWKCDCRCMCVCGCECVLSLCQASFFFFPFPLFAPWFSSAIILNQIQSTLVMRAATATLDLNRWRVFVTWKWTCSRIISLWSRRSYY